MMQSLATAGNEEPEATALCTDESAHPVASTSAASTSSSAPALPLHSHIPQLPNLFVDEGEEEVPTRALRIKLEDEYVLEK